MKTKLKKKVAISVTNSGLTESVQTYKNNYIVSLTNSVILLSDLTNI